MRVTAARLVEHGRPLEVQGVDLAEPQPEESVVDMAFAGVNPVDRYMSLGSVAPDGPLPRTLGSEGAGTVRGQQVLVHGHGIAGTRDGLWATKAVVPKEALIEVPTGLTSRSPRSWASRVLPPGEW
ncbi:MAG: alcohol dehydrogenase catalytic domain-containing protein [Acidimicrobiales bacterium]